MPLPGFEAFLNYFSNTSIVDFIPEMSSRYKAATSMPNHAYVTLLAGNGDHVERVVGLAKGLRKAKSNYPLVVAILPDVPEEHRRILLDQACIVREIQPLCPPGNSTQFAMTDYVCNYSKLRIWEFVQYSKMIYLDGDIQVFENIDHLFDMPDGYIYGVMDCFCEKTWSHTPQFKIGYCQQCPDKVKWAAELGPKPAVYFNAGMFVFEPSILTYLDLLNTLKTTPPTPFTEQDFLNMFFKDIYKPISPIYNLILPMLWRHPEKIELEQVKVVHYSVVGSKPWKYLGNKLNMEREDIKMLIQKWLDIYNDESLDFKNYPSAAASEAGADEEEMTFLQALWEAVDGCCSEDLNLKPILAGLWEAAGSCSSIENLDLQPFLEALWETGSGYIEELCSLPEQLRGRFIFMCWF